MKCKGGFQPIVWGFFTGTSGPRQTVGHWFAFPLPILPCWVELSNAQDGLLEWGQARPPHLWTGCSDVSRPWPTLLTSPSDAIRNWIFWAVFVWYCRRQPPWHSPCALHESFTPGCVEVLLATGLGSDTLQQCVRWYMVRNWIKQCRKNWNH